jgi:hypothetical protein
MKSYICVTKISFILVAAICLLSSCNKWHYDYPRVKVDLNQANELDQTEAVPQIQPVTSEIPADNGTVVQPSANESVSVEADQHQQQAPVAVEHKSPVKAKKEAKKPFSFIQKLMDGDRLFKVNEVEKSALTGWVRIMIILFVVGFILVLVGIFLSVFLHPGFWWLFYFFGSLCILAGFIVLILGLVGIMV